MLKLIRINYKYLKYVRILDILSWYIFVWRSYITVRIRNRDIAVRRNTNDLRVAIENIVEEFKILEQILPPNFNGNILDAGGYIGTASNALNSIFPESKIVLYEPSPENYAFSKLNLNGLDNVELINSAIAATSGNVALTDRGTGAWGYTIEKVAGTKLDTKINVVGINEILDEKRYEIIKLDIEGAEKRIFDECGDKLNTALIIIVELHERIVTGCEASFWKFSRRYNRLTIPTGGEKYLSISKELFDYEC